MSPEKERFFQNMEDQGLALTFDDVRLRTRRSYHSPQEVDITSSFSPSAELKVPIVSAAMDTVTESEMAIAMAKLGGLGVIHAGLSIEKQRKEARRVKLHLNGLIEHPITLDQERSVESVLNECRERKFDFRTFPVVDEERKLVGMLTQNDFDFCEDRSENVGKIMTSIDEITSAPDGTDIKSAYEIMKDTKKKTLPLIKEDGTIGGLYILSDVLRIVRENPDSYNIDDNGRLRVAAAVPTDPDEAMERIRAMESYIDVVVIDTAQGDSKYSFETLEKLTNEMRNTTKQVKEGFQGLDVVVGNVSDGESARMLAEEGADGIKVGQGPGSICTTRPETGIGTPQVTAVHECAKATKEFKDLYICADGGLVYPGDISIAIAAGADSVMLGGMLSGAKETPGEVITRDGKLVKMYRGMGSPSALRDSSASRKRYSTGNVGKPLAEGVEKYVSYRGPVADSMDHYIKALQKSMSYVGAPDIKTHQEQTRFWRITNAGLNESHPHDIKNIN